jgi:hypothetical protein
LRSIPPTKVSALRRGVQAARSLLLYRPVSISSSFASSLSAEAETEAGTEARIEAGPGARDADVDSLTTGAVRSLELSARTGSSSSNTRSRKETIAGESVSVSYPVLNPVSLTLVEMLIQRKKYCDTMSILQFSASELAGMLDGSSTERSSSTRTSASDSSSTVPVFSSLLPCDGPRGTYDSDTRWCSNMCAKLYHRLRTAANTVSGSNTG